MCFPWIHRCLMGALALCLLTSLPLQARDGRGRLVIAGGAITSAKEAVWQIMLRERLPGRPLGIISTASKDPAASGVPLADSLNAEHGPGTAIFIPLSAQEKNADHPAILAQIKGCGGFYFTGGSQSLTTRTLLRADRTDSPALAAIREVHRAGGVIGGSSAGAAIMSDPMITGGTSQNALTYGATPEDMPDGSPRGVGFAPGLGFSPGILYCQHHLERGRLGRLLAALASPAVGLRNGFGISEDTALLVDLEAEEASVIGARDVLYLRSNGALREKNGTISGFHLAYLTPGDRVLLSSGQVLPARDKQPLPGQAPAQVMEIPDAWGKSAMRSLFHSLAQALPGAKALAHDPAFDIVFQRQADSKAWVTAEGAPPRYTLDGIRLEVQPRTAAEQQK